MFCVSCDGYDVNALEGSIESSICFKCFVSERHSASTCVAAEDYI